MYKVRKVLNNNAVVVIDTDSMQESIMIGTGIGFQKKTNMVLDADLTKLTRYVQEKGVDVAARAAKNDDEVFRAVHTLKGVSQNLGFARLYEACYSMTEAVRGGVKLENEALFDAVAKEYQATVDCIKMYCE